MRELNLEVLEDGISTGLSVRYGGFMAEGASICLDAHGHGIICNLFVEESTKETYQLRRLEVDERSRTSFSDIDEAVEFGAMGIAIAIINNSTSWKVIRSWKGTGFDWWFGEESEEYPFQNKLRVEVAGDYKGTDNELQSRLKVKLNQTKKSDDSGLRACAVVVEFSNPKSLIAFR